MCSTRRTNTGDPGGRCSLGDSKATAHSQSNYKLIAFTRIHVMHFHAFEGGNFGKVATPQRDSSRLPATQLCVPLIPTTDPVIFKRHFRFCQWQMHHLCHRGWRGRAGCGCPVSWRNPTRRCGIWEVELILREERGVVRAAPLENLKRSRSWETANRNTRTGGCSALGRIGRWRHCPALCAARGGFSRAPH